jgi:hypothetical protein
MAYDETLKSITLDADASIGIYTGVAGTRGALSPNGGKQYYFVDITGEHKAGLTGAGEVAIGVLQNKPQHEGDAATVAIFGVTLVVAGELLTAGMSVASDADGKAVESGNGDSVLGRVVIGAGAEDELASVLLTV